MKLTQASIANMEETKLYDSVQYAKSLGFSEEALDEAIRRVGNPESPNELLTALIGIKSQDTCSDSTNLITEDTNLHLPSSPNASSINKESPSSSCYSSISSFQRSSSNLSVDGIQLGQILLRNIYIDGSNVAKTHGKDLIFSWLGIKICVDWFASRGHKVRVLVPEDKCSPVDDPVICYLKKNDVLIKTPSGCNDDNFIIVAAMQNNGVIVSNDQYRDEKRLRIDFQNFIYNNRLPYCFVDDIFIPALDPLGRFGPTLDEFLQHMPPGSIHKRLSQGKSHRRHRNLHSTTNLPACSFLANRGCQNGLRDSQFGSNADIKPRNNTFSSRPSVDNHHTRDHHQFEKSFSVGNPSQSNSRETKEHQQPRPSPRHHPVVYKPKSHKIQ